MKNKNQNFTNDDIAKNEPPLQDCDLLAEILPLLEDYFEGEIAFDGKAIIYKLPNGQRFKLSAKQSA